MVDRRSRARKKSTLDMGTKAPAKSGTLRLFVLLAIPTIRLTDWYSARLRSREQIGGIV